MSVINTPTTATTSTTDQAERLDRRLRTVLRVNAGTSLLSGLIMAAAPGMVDDVLDTGHPGWVRVVGIGLLLFAIDVAVASTIKRTSMLAATRMIIVGDIAWVLASVVTVLLGWYSGLGIVAVLAVAAMVDTFAVLQWRAMRPLRRLR